MASSLSKSSYYIFIRLELLKRVQVRSNARIIMATQEESWYFNIVYLALNLSIVVVLILGLKLFEVRNHNVNVNVHKTILIGHNSVHESLILFFGHQFLEVRELLLQDVVEIKTHKEIIELKEVFSEKWGIFSVVKGHYVNSSA